MENYKKISIKGSELLLDLERGAKIIRLILDGVIIIDSKP